MALQVTYEVEYRLVFDINGRRTVHENWAASYKRPCKSWPTVQQAERSARALHRQHGVSVEITQVMEDKRRLTRDRVATIRSDAFGRVWTDLAGVGPTLL